MNIRIQYNNLESGDWVQVWRDDDGDPSVLLFEGHRIDPPDLVDILEELNIKAAIQEVDDEGFDLAN